MEKTYLTQTEAIDLYGITDFTFDSYLRDPSVRVRKGKMHRDDVQQLVEMHAKWGYWTKFYAAYTGYPVRRIDRQPKHPSLSNSKF